MDTLDGGLNPNTITLALCGDVMTGRAVDQILRYPSNPVLYESYIRDAREYVKLAENKNGPIPRGVDPSYIWGDSLRDLESHRPDARIINLETAVTASDRWEDKGINYRMNPKNIDCLTIAKVSCCTLANNHVLDWGQEGLVETIESIRGVGTACVGAGRDQAEAEAPAIINLGARGRILVFGMGHPSSGIPRNWAAERSGPGVHLIQDLSLSDVANIKRQIEAVKQVNDIVVVSIHWGENWGYEIPKKHIDFAHALMDQAGVDLIHGHSSHHVKGYELYQGKLILYGCGDFINDYEGIGGYETYRGDLSVLYFVQISTRTKSLLSLDLKAYTMRRFRLQKAHSNDVAWLRDLLAKQSRSKSGFSLSL